MNIQIENSFNNDWLSTACLKDTEWKGSVEGLRNSCCPVCIYGSASVFKSHYEIASRWKVVT